jgi:hypothetical protein
VVRRRFHRLSLLSTSRLTRAFSGGAGPHEMLNVWLTAFVDHAKRCSKDPTGALVRLESPTYWSIYR